MTTILDIADAVVAELNGVPAGTFSQALVAVRMYVPVFKLEDMGVLHVTVVPHGQSFSQVGRGLGSSVYIIDVAIQQRVSLASNTALDALVVLVRQIAAWFLGKRMAARPGAMCLALTNDPAWMPKHLEELSQFTSVLSLSFEVIE